MSEQESSFAQERDSIKPVPARESYVPTYRSLLKEPTVLLAGNPNDRPDVATAAILGYN